MASGWQDLADTLNKRFADPDDIKNMAKEFKDKHGPTGNGGGGKQPYRFGHFVHGHGKLGLSTNAENRFFMDSGSRHWGGDGTGNPRGKPNKLLILEAVVKHSLTQTQPKQITFTIETDYSATYATAVVTGDASPNEINATSDPNIAASNTFDVLIKCPPSP